MSWVVSEDHIDGDTPDSAFRQGQYPGKTVFLSDLPHKAELYDDDGILYYTIRFDDAAEENDEEYGGLYQCWEWGMWYAGATDLRINGKSIYA